MKRTILTLFFVLCASIMPLSAQSPPTSDVAIELNTLKLFANERTVACSISR